MTAAPAAVVVAVQSLFSDSGLVDLLGAAAAALAFLGLLLLVPLYITHRREVQRLLEWKERDPEAGTTEFRAVPGRASAPAAPVRTGGGKMTPAERVTSERPALTRISTGEYAAIEPEQERPHFFRRVIERGPRHPLILTLLAILIGAVVFVVASKLIRSDEDTEGKGQGVDPASVEVAVVNATSEPGVADAVSDRLTGKGFVVSGTSVSSQPAKVSGVFYDTGLKPEGRAVQRALGLPAPSAFEPEQEAAASGADVVVVAGEDGRAESTGGKGGKG